VGDERGTVDVEGTIGGKHEGARRFAGSAEDICMSPSAESGKDWRADHAALGTAVPKSRSICGGARTGGGVHSTRR
jgi:hypothetical protein